MVSREYGGFTSGKNVKKKSCCNMLIYLIVPAYVRGQCGLCVKVCPVGAIKGNNKFDFTACYSHNYRERLGGFQNWVEQVVDSRNHIDSRRRVSDKETISMWQNLSIGAQTRCDRCVALCPAGEEPIGAYLHDRKEYVRRYIKPFEELEEPRTVHPVK